MPYKRTRRQRRKYTKVSKISYAQMAMKAFEGVKYLKGLINSELKFVDISPTLTFTPGGNVSLLTQTAEGTDEGQRNGRSILAKNMKIDCQLVNNSSASNGTFVRMIYFHDRVTEGTTATTSELLQNAGSIISPLNHDHFGPSARFRLIRDYRTTLNPSGTSNKVHTVRVPLKGHHIKYQGTGSTISDCLSGHIFVLCMSDQSSNTPGYLFNSRLQFYDN